MASSETIIVRRPNGKGSKARIPIDRELIMIQMANHKMFIIKKDSLPLNEAIQSAIFWKVV